MRLSLAKTLCNDPFYKPLHPPGLRPSPFLSILWRRKGDLSNHICVASEPPQSDLRSSSPTPAVQLRWQGKRCKPLSDGLRPPAPPVRLALRYGRQGERYIPNAIQAKSSYISANWPLLSKGLRGGKSRSDRVVSLLRRMIASEDAKKPTENSKAREPSKDMACYIRQKERDDLVELGEFAETQVQRPPEQKPSFPRICR